MILVQELPIFYHNKELTQIISKSETDQLVISHSNSDDDIHNLLIAALTVGNLDAQTRDEIIEQGGPFITLPEEVEYMFDKGIAHRRINSLRAISISSLIGLPIGALLGLAAGGIKSK